MNFKITHNWLKDHIATKATPEQILEYISLSGPNVETIEKIGDDYVYDIEVTANRTDAGSVIGFAKECAAILPRYDVNAELTSTTLDNKLSALTGNDNNPTLTITDFNPQHIHRVTAIVIENISVGDSPDFIKERLEAIGERSINNIVDITNYVRAELGHPLHAFDYDKVKNNTLSIIESSQGQKITLLDDSEIDLPGGDLVITDDGERLIDLVGIMGGRNTQVDENTQRIVLFIPTPHKHTVRKTSMSTGVRSSAVTYFEKGIDPERHEAVAVRASELITEHAKGMITSTIIDMYPEPFTGKQVEVSLQYIQSLINISITADEIETYIAPLGFSIETRNDTNITINVPSYRAEDATSQADIAEEVARIYGYQHIPTDIQKTEVVYQPLETQRVTDMQDTARGYLSNNGWNEQYNYSMISEDLINLMGLELHDHIQLSNTISEEIEYMRGHIVPSLVKNIKDNTGIRGSMSFFECAATYIKQDNELPIEEQYVAMATTHDFYTLKGYIESLFDTWRIRNAEYVPSESKTFTSAQSHIDVIIDGEVVGYMSSLKESVRVKTGIEHAVSIAECNLDKIAPHIKDTEPYREPHGYSVIKLDYTYTSSPNLLYSKVKKIARETSSSLLNMSVLDVYEDKVTVRFEFGHPDRNMTEDEAKVELEKIQSRIS